MVLRAVTSILEEKGARLAVAGGWAMNSYGRGRATFDLDLVVPYEMQDLLVRRLEAMGYERLHRSPGYTSHLHRDPTWGRLDLIYVRADIRALLRLPEVDRDEVRGYFERAGLGREYEANLEQV